MGVLGGNTTSYIIESAVSGALIRTNSNGYSGTQADLDVTYSPAAQGLYGNQDVQSFSIWEKNVNNTPKIGTPHQFITSSAAGELSLKADISGSIYTSTANTPLSASATFIDEYGNVGSGSFNIHIRTNNAPTITLTPDDQTITAEEAVSGSLITSASFIDTEGDDINYDSFTLTGPDAGNFSFERIGDGMSITTHTDLSASSYQFTAGVYDEHAFNQGTEATTVTVTPMIYLYKNTDSENLINQLGRCFQLLGDTSGDGIDIESGSFIGHLMSGSMGNISMSSNDGYEMTLIGSQSLNHLVSSQSGHNTFRNFGNVILEGNSGLGHQWVLLYPSSSVLYQKPDSLSDLLDGGVSDDPGEYTVFVDNASSDLPVTAGLYYFSTNTGVKVQGENRWGMLFARDTNNSLSQYYYLLPSSGSEPTSELP